jgi:hypothetical protein
LLLLAGCLLACETARLDRAHPQHRNDTTTPQQHQQQQFLRSTAATATRTRQTTAINTRQQNEKEKQNIPSFKKE